MRPWTKFGAIAHLAFITFAASAQPAARIALELAPARAHHCQLKLLAPGEWEITTTGNDPHLFTAPIPPAFAPARHHILSFEFTSSTGTPSVQIFLVPPGDEKHSTKAPGLKMSDAWSGYTLDLKGALDRTPRKPSILRIDLGNQPGKIIKLRALALRETNAEERQIERVKTQKRETQAKRDAALANYLNRPHACAITRVEVTAEQVKIQGRLTGEIKDLSLAELPVWINAAAPGEFSFITPIPPSADGIFTILLPRREASRDRLLSRWAIVRRRGADHALESAARWADGVQAEWEPPPARLRSKKGLGGFHAGANMPVADLDELGISAVTVNISLNDLFRSTPAAGRTPFEYGGRTFYAQDARIAALDRTLQVAARRRAIVSAIILINQAAKSPDKALGALLAHPDADPSGIFTMPNLTGEEGVRAYAAALDFLARRYMGAAGKLAHGRIHHWIMHNEVNAGWIWTNAGEKSAPEYMELYHKSIRLAHLIGRQYDAHAKAFISLDHHWTALPGPHCHSARDLMDLLVSFSKTEGDFEWAIAHHPYPQDLFNPRVWEDTQAALSLNTPKITMKNIEVLDHWVRQPRAMYLGKTPRSIHLTEQGFNSRDYSEKSLTEQAAAMVYTWKKLEKLQSIEVFHYHNWIDNRHEGGLRIGLRRFPDDAEQKLGIKPIWSVYKALGTPAEEGATQFAKTVVGVKDWGEVKIGTVTQTSPR